MAQDLNEVYDYNFSWALNEDALHRGKTRKYKIIAGTRYCTVKIGQRIAYLFEYTDPDMIKKVKEKMKDE